MTEQFVPALTFITSGITLLFSIAIPVAMYIFLKKKFRCKKFPFFTGCITFTIFALILEGSLNAIILGGDRTELFMAKPILFSLYGGLMAGIFEETGRFIVFKTVLKKYHSDDYTSLAYGAGHGGFEAIFIVFSAMITNIIFGILINTGNTELITANLDEAHLEAMNKTFDSLQNTNPMLILLTIVERVGAIAFHIAASVIVWFSAVNKKRWYLYPTAIILHFILDAGAAYMSLSKVNAFIIELYFYITTAFVVMIAIIIWKTERKNHPAKNN